MLIFITYNRPNMPKTPKLYGLLIGIDDYPIPVPPLKGCVNDIHKVRDYLLDKQQELEPQLLILLDEDATKAAIIDGFRRHLSQAGPEDSVLLYFAGHGTQEQADARIWTSESDGKLECIVNYDGIVREGDQIIYNLLADKELRFLINVLAQRGAHILTIFDCCHSGGNTRKIQLDTEEDKPRSRRYESRLTTGCPQRPWEQFLFAGDIDPKALAEQPLYRVMPAGQHVQMAACRSDQEAYELQGGGVFTNTLISLLEDSRGGVTYSDLRSRIRYMIKHEFKQTPQVYVQGDDGQQLFSGFLGRPVSRELNEGNFVFNKEEGWILDMGAIHGLSPDLGSVKIEDPEGGGFSATVRSVKMSHTRLQVSGPEVETRLDRGKAYRAFVPGVLAQPIRVFLNKIEPENEGWNFLDKEWKTFKDRLLLVEDEQQADYVVHIQDTSFVITLPFDPGRPVVDPLRRLSEKAAYYTTVYLRNMAKWHFVRDLHNPNVHLFRKLPLEIEFFMVDQNDTVVPLEFNGEEIILPLRKMPNGAWGNFIRLRATNRHDSRLYCSLIYLSEAFQIYSSLFGAPTIFLDPGASIGGPMGKDLEQELELPKHIVNLNVPNSIFWMKFIMSTEEFDPTTFDEPALPMPTVINDRGIKLAKPPKVNASDWTVKTVRVRMPNPEFKREEN